MNHTLLVYCMRFCIDYVILQPSATSVDKVNAYGQLSGKKLDAKRDLRDTFGDYALATLAATDNSMLPRAKTLYRLWEKV